MIDPITPAITALAVKYGTDSKFRKKANAGMKKAAKAAKRVVKAANKKCKTK